jgi:hypothetical protein
VVLLFYCTTFFHFFDALIKQGLQIFVQAEAPLEILLSLNRFTLP